MLGSGAFGETVLCCRRHDPSDTNYEWVAVKIMKRPLDPYHEEELAFLQREAENQCMLRHKHVCRFIEVGVVPRGEDDHLFLCFEHANMGDMAKWLKSVPGGRLDEDSARYLFQQLVAGVSHCHGKGVVHRDLKPGNLLLHEVGGSPFLKVADFGWSKSDALSMPHTRAGTSAYAAPEAYSGADQQYAGNKADVFSAGVILYQMLYGVHPFWRDPESPTTSLNPDKNAKHQKIVEQNIRAGQALAMRPPDTAPPGEALAALLSGMLKYDPEERWSLGQVMENSWFGQALDGPGLKTLLAAYENEESEAAQLKEHVESVFKSLSLP
ncbi:hypothetical protein HYH03_005709 [Edaphochlamys debaryana]|uniref:Protein kinase domain-containing protein n=1 Tax=Edaphochlamys debaryana TaxID=47281 RepID=A0A836C0Q9_9CHLO|nr:hypothetical protein HYH03_005709 [Edaphochlamys debaryana]|eukprot:KAG2496106.1 hypothetical protein HYH03_005709 [Edaphochlamys debaryana]